MILGGELTPVAKLSAAFLAPRSPLHLQFAYYESSLVVEFLVERFGFETLTAILRDLGEGTDDQPGHRETHAPRWPKLEKDFAAFARSRRAEQMAPGLDWEKPGRWKADSGQAAATWQPLERPPTRLSWMGRQPDEFLGR